MLHAVPISHSLRLFLTITLTSLVPRPCTFIAYSTKF